jgi:hypothetical protein
MQVRFKEYGGAELKPDPRLLKKKAPALGRGLEVRIVVAPV